MPYTHFALRTPMPTATVAPTSIDIMSTALALAGPGPLDSSTAVWNGAFRAATLDPAAAALLAILTFELHARHDQLSDEIENLRRVLIRSDVLWLTGGMRQPLMVWASERARAGVLDLNAPLLADQRLVLERMAATLASHLARTSV